MRTRLHRILAAMVGLGFVFGGTSFGQESKVAAAATATFDKGDTAWMLASCALVLFMTPGLAFFYGGLVRSKNVLSTMMHSYFCLGLCTVVWFAVGGGIAFGPSIGGYFGNPSELAFLNGVGHEDIWDPTGKGIGTVPVFVFFTFQMMFAIITPALISGAFAERIKFSAFCVFTAFWLLLVYCPICHWVWNGGLLSDTDHSWLKTLGLPGAIDFAGGTVVHISSGVSALVFCLFLGKRRGYPDQPMPPHNLPLCLLGAGMLWFGWFGFNAGSEGATDGVTGSAFLVTHICAATAGLSWAIIEWVHRGKASALGVATGVVAGLVCITPASGAVYPREALIMGIVVALVCYLFVAVIKARFRYDDSLDVFGVHGVGGTVGALLSGVLCTEALGKNPGGAQFAAQFVSVVVTWVYAGGMTLLFLVILDKTIGVRATEDDELAGLDISQHGEKGYQV